MTLQSDEEPAFNGKLKGFKTDYSAFDTGCQEIFECCPHLKNDNNPSLKHIYL